MSAIKCIIAFAIGAAAGFAGGYFFAKDRYEKDIKEFKEEYRQKNADVVAKQKETAKRNEELKEQIMDMTRYKEHLEEANYISREEAMRKQNDPGKPGEPYVISQDEFDDPDYNEYRKDIEFSLYNDGIMTDEVGEEMHPETIERLLGTRWSRWMSENPGEDACFVRNDVKKIDYIVVRVDGDFYAEGE